MTIVLSLHPQGSNVSKVTQQRHDHSVMTASPGLGVRKAIPSPGLKIRKMTQQRHDHSAMIESQGLKVRKVTQYRGRHSKEVGKRLTKTVATMSSVTTARTTAKVKVPMSQMRFMTLDVQAFTSPITVTPAWHQKGSLHHSSHVLCVFL